MRRGIPAVVAMQYEISDEAAVTFAKGFYTAIAAQHPVEQAVTRARRAVKVARRNTLEWATPVLYLRSPQGAVFDLTDVPAPSSSAVPETLPPEVPKSEPSEPGEKVFNLGNLLHQQGDIAGARAAYQQAIDSGDHEWAPKAVTNLGVLLAEQGDPDGARVAFQRAIDSGHADQAQRAAGNLGLLLAEQGDPDGARAAYQRAIDSDHTDHARKAAINLRRLTWQQRWGFAVQDKHKSEVWP